MSNQAFQLAGTFYWQRYDAGGRLLAEGVARNNITTAGLNHVLETQFRAGSQVTAWYLGLINQAGFTALAAADTMASHGGWTETGAYSEVTRPQWSPGAAASGLIVNTTRVLFTINAVVTIKGFFVTSNNTKAGTTGTLWAHVVLDQDQQMSSGEQLKLVYDLTAAAG